MCILLSRDLCSCRKSTQLTQSSPTISNIDANLSHWLFSAIIYSENVTFENISQIFLKQVLLINWKDKKNCHLVNQRELNCLVFSGLIQCVICTKILSYYTYKEVEFQYPVSVCFFLYACFICHAFWYFWENNGQKTPIFEYQCFLPTYRVRGKVAWNYFYKIP